MRALKFSALTLLVVAAPWISAAEAPATGTSALGLIQELGITLKFLEAQDDNSNPFGASWDFSRDFGVLPITEESLENNFTNRRLDLRVTSRGNYAFGAPVAPENFGRTDVTVGFHMDRGGHVKLSDAGIERKKELTMEIIDLEGDALRKAQAELRSLTTLEEYMDPRSGRNPDAWLINASLGLGIEYDSNFELSNSLTSANLGFAYSGRSRIVAPSLGGAPLAARLNLLDYPFALVRGLIDPPPDSARFLPNTRLPSIDLAFSRVDPSEDNPRVMLGETDEFSRFEFATTFKTTVIPEINGTQTFFVLNYRYYRELSPSQAIRDAGLDKFDFVRLGLQYGSVYIGWSKGQLPFDVETNDFFEVGWTFKPEGLPLTRWFD